MKKKAISTRYILTVLPVLFVILAVLGGSIYLLNRQHVMREFEQQGLLATQQVANTLQNWIQDQVRISKMISQAPEVVEACSNPRNHQAAAAAQRYLQSIHQQFPYYENLPLAAKMADGDSFEIDVKGDKKTISSGKFFVDTVEGKTIGKAGTQLSYIQAVFGGKDYYISEVYPSLLRGNPIFVVAVPVKKEGTVVGAVILAPQMSYFTDQFVKNTKLGETGYVFFFDDRKITISHPNKSLILNKESVARVEPIFSKVVAGLTNFSATFDGVAKRYVGVKVTIPIEHIKHQWYICAAKDSSEILASSRSFALVLLVASLVSFVIIAGTLYWVTGVVVVRPLDTIRSALHDISQGNGDLTRRLDAGCNDEIGELAAFFNDFVDKIHRIILKVAENVVTTRTDSRHLQQSSGEIAREVEAGANQVSGIAAASEEMANTSHLIADGCMQAAEKAQHAANSANLGFELVKSTVEGIQQRGDRTRENGKIVSSLGDRSNQIGAIVSTIEDIADQTNLLALNAAIEAARAGEMGRGFAVVADEVRALAERTTKATKEISEMIRAIQNETRQAIVSMEEGVKGTEKGAAEANRLEAALQNILEQISNVTQQVSQIASVAEQQTTATTGIKNNISTVSTVIDYTARGASDTSAAAGKLAENADELQRLIGQFKL
jgi:methyl-accepting chemotaxis protein